MKNIKDIDSYLGKWLNDDLDKEALDSFKDLDEFKDYEAIVSSISKIKKPQVSADAAYEDFKKKLESREKTSIENDVKVIKTNWSRYIAYAASIIVICGIAVIWSGQTSVNTLVAQQTKVSLPDNSLVSLNASSKLSYNKILFLFNRKLDLDGEAFFEVEKGQKFTVVTPNGSISVLGTKFNVVSRKTYFETSCYEGKVKVVPSNSKQEILTKGKKVIVTNSVNELRNEIQNKETPEWISGKSKFKSVALKYVLLKLEAQFGVKFNVTDKKILTQLYSGAFSNNDLKSALESVFLPMGIKYKIDGTLIYLSKK